MNNEEEFHRSSTVIGVSYSKQLIHMFILRGFLKERNSEEEVDNSINISMKLYYKKYRVKSEVDLLILWVDILNFSKIFLSSYNVQSAVSIMKEIPQHQNLSYWNLKPFIDSRSDEDDVLFKIQNQIKKLCLVPNMAINKRIISEAKNEIGYSCKIQNTTFVKRIEKEEKYIVSKLLESRNISRCLPQVMNIYNSFIEYEELLPLSNRLMECELYSLCLDICHALECLHSLNIIHRDVKMQNIMIRNPDNNPTLQRFVLIDFSMSFHFEKTDSGYIDTFTRVLANENYGTNSYKAPEVLTGDCYDEKIDVFSLGASILCCLDRKRFVCSKKEDLQKMVDRLEWKNTQFKQVIRMMVNKDPSERPTPRQIQDILNQVQTIPLEAESLQKDLIVSSSRAYSPSQGGFGCGVGKVQEDSVRQSCLATNSSQQSLVDETLLLRDEEPFKFYTPSKRDSDSDDEDYDSDDSLSPIYSTRTPIVERSDFEFD
ncbi:predicted protein [Naegleria gruberi]|uniref:Predicted protein n=1 Tax=Naegleria gruberi TaxID=5762 RepID=D2VGF6_NAEGR|nr:uncharacterized protein NAEGRDRAFT_67959 [Naegleria gruberi]EFC44055.1 predicted protein [Naegleria gruberi]|eukprot:XP_002676799.1 predicted protein [Naegleria gruberi strain NEG-M]